MCAVALAGCAAESTPPPTVVVTSTHYVPYETPAPAPVPPPAPAAPQEGQSLLDASLASASAYGTVGVAVAGPEGVETAGLSEPTPAWSTIKVPIAVAALRAAPEMYGDAVAAITASDNGAAERLYNTAGPAGVNAVLAEAGLQAVVNTEKIRPEFSTFGQTTLGVGEEAALANALACVPGAAQVLQLMGQVDGGQSYGLGQLGGLFKGGWGPDVSGMYHVRQFGLIPRGDGTWAAVAVTALPADGTYETGQTMLNAVAQTLGTSAQQLPAAACQP